MKKIIFIILLGTLLVLPLMAGPIRVSFRDSTILRGRTVYIPVWIDSSLTGLNVKSYELDVSYSADPMIIDSVITAGSMTESWGTPAFHLTSGRITVAGAGTNPLNGTGILLYLKLYLPISSTWPYASLTFNRVFFNEGSPSTVIRNGTISITNLPIITITPDNALLTVGETRQFYAYGGKLPYNWFTTDPFVAGISSSGLLTGLHGGSCKVVVADSNGITDTTSMIEVRSFKLSIRDTSYLQGQTINIPVYISDLSLVDVHSGTFSVSFNSNILTSLGIVQTGTLLEKFPAPATNISSGKITIAFAGDTSRLDAVETMVLLYLRFKITEINSYYTTLQIADVIFNETLAGNFTNGNFSVIPRANLTVSPGTATLVAPDSLQFNVSGGAISPVIWSVSDTTLAKISSTGKLKALKSGIVQVSAVDFVGATGISGNITLYDMHIQILNASGKAGDSVDVDIQVGAYPPGIFSSQFTLSYNQNYFTPLQIVTAGTLFEGRMTDMAAPNPGSVNVTAAGANPATGPGILLRVKFKILDPAPLGTYAVNFTTVLLNEGKPLALPGNGQIAVGTTGVGDNSGMVPESFALSQNFPNPFNPSTKIKYKVQITEYVNMKVYNLLGNVVATLVNEVKQPGEYTVQWDASASSGLPSGIYFYKLDAGSFADMKKMIFLK